MDISCIFLVMLVLFSNALSSRLSIVQDRLRALEDRVYVDSREFRHEFQRVFDILNSSFFDNNVDFVDSSITSDKKSQNPCENENNFENTNRDLNSLKRGFAEEKLRLRNYVKILELSLEKIEQDVAKNLKDIQSDASNLQKDLSDTCRQQEYKLQNMSDRIQTNNELLLHQLSNTKQSVLKKLNDLSEMSSLQGNSLQNVSEILKAVNLLTDQSETTHERIHRIEAMLKTMLNATKAESTSAMNIGNQSKPEQKENLAVLSKLSRLVLWESFERSYYHVGTIQQTWYQADQKCRDLGAHLAEVNSVAEQEFLNKISMSKQLTWHALFLGGTDESNEGHWTWKHSGYPINIQFWAPGEPNDKTGNEDCLHMRRDLSYGGWNDISCDTKFFYICEAP